MVGVFSVELRCWYRDGLHRGCAMIRLSAKQIEVVRLICSGVTDIKELCDTTGYSYSSIYRIVDRIYKPPPRMCGRRLLNNAVQFICSVGLDGLNVVKVDDPSPSLGWEDILPRERPGIRWPDYSPHNLSIRSKS